MRNNSVIGKKRFAVTESKKDKEYKSIHEYLYDLNPITETEYTFEELIDLLEIFDRMNIDEEIDIDFSNIKTKSDLIKLINNFSENKIGRFDYDKKSKELKTSDLVLNTINRSVMSINIRPFIDNEKRFSKPFNKYIKWFLYKVYESACCYSSYEYVSGWGLESCIESAEESEESCKEQVLKDLNDFVDYRDNYLSKGQKRPKTCFESSWEEFIFQIMEEVLNFNYNHMYEFIDIDEHYEMLQSEYEERYEDIDEEQVKDIINGELEAYFRGNYILTCSTSEENDYILNNYVSYINEEENNSMRYLNISQETTYTKDGQKNINEKSKKAMFKHLNNFDLIDKLMKQYDGNEDNT